MLVFEARVDDNDQAFTRLRHALAQAEFDLRTLGPPILDTSAGLPLMDERGAFIGYIHARVEGES